MIKIILIIVLIFSTASSGEAFYYGEQKTWVCLSPTLREDGAFIEGVLTHTLYMQHEGADTRVRSELVECGVTVLFTKDMPIGAWSSYLTATETVNTAKESKPSDIVLFTLNGIIAPPTSPIIEKPLINIILKQE